MRSFLDSIRSLSIPDRERAILGRPDLWVDWPMVEVQCGAATLRVYEDVFAIGTPDDPMRIPLTPGAAQRIADELGMHMIAPRMSDAIWAASKSGVRLSPEPISPDAEMMSVGRFVAHNACVERQRAGRRGLTAGHKKDVVICKRLALEPDKVAIYGMHRANGVAIQPYQMPHEWSYVDYSHGARFVAATCWLDGAERRVERVLRSVTMAHHLSGEGPLTVTRYRT